MTTRVLVSGESTSVQVASHGEVVEDAAALAEELHEFRPNHRLVQIWYSGSTEKNEQAYWEAQAIYGLPGATREDQEAPAGLLHFWTRVRSALEQDLNLARQRMGIDSMATA